MSDAVPPPPSTPPAPAPPAPATPESATAPSLRARQQEATRASIIEAFLDLSHRDGAASVSVPGVAAACGISTRTVYRYFATKDDLQTAAAYHLSRQALPTNGLEDANQTNMAEMLKVLWRSFDENRSWVIAEHATPAGREIRSTRLEGGRALVRRSLPADVDDDTVDLLVAVTSSSMFLELVDRMGHSPDVAASMATRLALLIIADVQPESDPT